MFHIPYVCTQTHISSEKACLTNLLFLSRMCVRIAVEEKVEGSLYMWNLSYCCRKFEVFLLVARRCEDSIARADVAVGPCFKK